MATLNLRCVDDTLVTSLKKRAIDDGKTLKSFCVEALWFALSECGGKYADIRRTGTDSPGTIDRSGKSSALPAVRSAKGSTKRLRTVQSMRGELAQRGGLGQGPENRPIQADGRGTASVIEECRKAGHLIFKRSGVDWCSTCHTKNHA
jgi:hypothetical protein